MYNHYQTSFVTDEKNKSLYHCSIVTINHKAEIISDSGYATMAEEPCHFPKCKDWSYNGNNW